jgi:hypothetical protein
MWLTTAILAVVVIYVLLLLFNYRGLAQRLAPWYHSFVGTWPLPLLRVWQVLVAVLGLICLVSVSPISARVPAISAEVLGAWLGAGVVMVVGLGLFFRLRHRHRQ